MSVLPALVIVIVNLLTVLEAFGEGQVHIPSCRLERMTQLCRHRLVLGILGHRSRTTYLILRKLQHVAWLAAILSFYFWTSGRKEEKRCPP